MLGNEFERAIENFDISKTNRIPLLRRVFPSGRFNEDETNYRRVNENNYFHFVGTKIAERLIEHKDCLDIWIG